LETEEVGYESVGEFLAETKKNFEEGNKELLKIAELKRIDKGGRTMEKFMQDFKRVARGSRYEGCPLIEEFKWGINRAIRRKLIEMENQSGSRELLPWIKIGRRAKEKKESNKTPASKSNNREAQRQILS